MILQQVNLYQPRFRPQRLWLSGQQLVLGLALLLLGVVVWSFILHNNLEQAMQRNQMLQAEQRQVGVELGEVNGKLAKLVDERQLDQQIAQLARQVSARKKVLSFVDANRLGAGEGFSGYLAALANLHQSDIRADVWLNQIRLADRFIEIRGSSMRAEQVPNYFDQFGSEAVFAGQRFDMFQLERAKETDWKVDFLIATREINDE